MSSTLITTAPDPDTMAFSEYRLIFIDFIERYVRPRIAARLDTTEFALFDGDSNFDEFEPETPEHIKEGSWDTSFAQIDVAEFHADGRYSSTVSPSSLPLVNKRTADITYCPRRPRALSAAASLDKTVNKPTSSNLGEQIDEESKLVTDELPAVYRHTSLRRGRSMSAAAALCWTVHLLPPIDDEEPTFNTTQYSHGPQASSEASSLGRACEVRAPINSKDSRVNVMASTGPSAISCPPSPTISDDSGFYSSISSSYYSSSDSDDEDQDSTYAEEKKNDFALSPWAPIFVPAKSSKLSAQAPVFIPFKPFESSLSAQAPVFVPFRSVMSSLSAQAPVFVPFKPVRSSLSAEAPVFVPF